MEILIIYKFHFSGYKEIRGKLIKMLGEVFSHFFFFFMYFSP